MRCNIKAGGGGAGWESQNANKAVQGFSPSKVILDFLYDTISEGFAHVSLATHVSLVLSQEQLCL